MLSEKLAVYSLSSKLEASSILHTLELRQTRRTLSDLCQLDALTAQGISKLTLDAHEGP